MLNESQPKLLKLEGKALQDPELINPIMRVLKSSYEPYGFWLGDEHFFKKTLPNTTLAQYFIRDKVVVAADVYNGNRMLMLGVEPKLQGSKFGQMLLREALDINPKTWMTASVVREAGNMIRLLSNPGFNLLLIQSLDEIKDLYMATSNVIPDDEFQEEMISHAILERNLGWDQFLAFSHSRSVHGPDYLQFAFKHVPQRADTIA